MLRNSLLYLFLAANGARSLFAEMFTHVHRGANALPPRACLGGDPRTRDLRGGRLLRFDAGTLAVASQPNIGGAASAVAIASARGYGDKLLPGIAVALAGYAVGNYFGLGMGMLAWALLGG